jgi:AmiR/NasT family two-component response regulator
VAKRYRVALHAHATAVVFVDANDSQEANRLAQAEVKAGKVKPLPIKEWSPVMTIDLDRKF